MANPNAWKQFATRKQIADHEKQEADVRRMYREMFPVLHPNLIEYDILSQMQQKPTT